MHEQEPRLHVVPVFYSIDLNANLHNREVWVY
jgi:hypothetical protein